ncbi:DUF6612 family protein [Paenibacillus sp. DMB5]|uniref:DUF6612 family protein n=1 Tax=Paenibacillus sp. DMB5 TaxID=1780103 RepID=UPI00076CD5E9|nr:DUF6612 family protein [Paenibacillus sp. DMB5]KUP25626.1 hypothetical protein AWJ19_20500 [Paenibacillus sp. DMB5]
MKKWGKGILAALIAVSLAGCADGGASEKQEKEAEKLIDRIAEAGGSLNSYVQESHSRISTGISPDTKAAEYTSETTTTSEYILDPLQMHQAGSMIIGDKEPADTESYFTDDGYYMLLEGLWRKMPDSFLEDLKLTVQVQSSPVRRMEMLKTILPYVTVSETGEEYILSAQLSGDQTKDLEDFYKLQYSSEELALQQLELLKSMSLEYRVDKQTYWPTGTTEELVIEEMLDGEGTYREVKQEATMSKYNTVKDIVIPEETLTAAE